MSILLSMHKPDTNEFNPYFKNYINLVPEGPFKKVYQQNTIESVAFFKQIPADKLMWKYEEGKWTINEILMHIIDVERVMQYRALLAARADIETPVHRMNDEKYVEQSGAQTRHIEDLIDEFLAVRAAGEKLFLSIDTEKSKFIINPGDRPFSARALAYIILGHSLHHQNIIRSRYLQMPIN